jgi:hypothetical protein
MNLINIRRVAAGCRSLADLRARAGELLGKGVFPGKEKLSGKGELPGKQVNFTKEDVESITEMVITRLAQRAAV